MVQAAGSEIARTARAIPKPQIYSAPTLTYADHCRLSTPAFPAAAIRAVVSDYVLIRAELQTHSARHLFGAMVQREVVVVVEPGGWSRKGWQVRRLLLA